MQYFSSRLYLTMKHWVLDRVGFKRTRLLGDKNIPKPSMVFVHSGVFLNLSFTSKALLGCGLWVCGFLKCGFLANVFVLVKYKTTVKTAKITTAKHNVRTRRSYFPFAVFTLVCSNKTVPFTSSSSESRFSSLFNGWYSPVFSDGAEKVK